MFSVHPLPGVFQESFKICSRHARSLSKYSLGGVFCPEHIRIYSGGPEINLGFASEYFRAARSISTHISISYAAPP
jgi:hypothetical protein